jgi:predicted AAA+ superfamily ATPase
MLQQTANLGKTVVIDEIQKLPKLLDTVHEHIERNQRKFILTGSSARRLKQQGANLLAGRASVYDLFPFSTLELGKDFSLSKALEFGGLPSAYLASDEESKEYLNAYVLLYLEKEIQQEQWVRKIEPFRRFLAVAAQMNGKVINRAKIAREVGVDNATIASYYEILEDTLMGLTLPAFDRSVRKSQGKTPKFYFIDPGIKRAIDKTLRVPLVPGTAAFGEAFEHWVVLELVKEARYRRLDWSFSFVRTKDDVEIDLVIRRPGEPHLLVEIKSKERVTEADAKALETLGRDLDPHSDRWILSRDPLEQRFGGTRALNWEQALRELFG